MMLDARDVRLAVRACVVLLIALCLPELLKAIASTIEASIYPRKVFTQGIEVKASAMIFEIGPYLSPVVGLFSAWVALERESILVRAILRAGGRP